MRAFVLRMVAAKNSKEAAGGVVAGAGGDCRHGDGK